MSSSRRTRAGSPTVAPRARQRPRIDIELDPSTKVFDRPVDFEPKVGAEAAGTLNGPGADYIVAAYQYATTAVPEKMQPKRIIVPGANFGDAISVGHTEQERDIMLKDVIRTVEFASKCDIAVALRSGGHSFAGYSSTGGDNIQLDMKHFKSIAWAPDKETITCGAGTKVQDLDAELAKQLAFIPHGQCGTVAVGGHLTTCGYSVVLPRSFGLMIDHVVGFTIVLAPEERDGAAIEVKLTKPDPDQPDARNDDLWFAVLGGGPGSFGVVIDVTFRPLLSSNYPDSRCLNTYLRYTPQKYQQCIEYLAGLAADDDLPADFNGAVCLLGNNHVNAVNVDKGNPIAAAKDAALRKAFGSVENTGLDEQMKEQEPQVYGPAMPPMFSVIVFSTSWSNLKGKAEPFETCTRAQEFFKAQEVLLDREEGGMDHVLHWALDAAHTLGIKGSDEFQLMNYDKPTPLHEVTAMTTITPRSHANPYFGASHVITNDCRKIPKVALDAGGDPLDGPTFLTQLQDAANNTPNVYPDVEFVIYGGKHSMVRTENCLNPKTCAPFRDTTKAYQLYYIHYDAVVAGKDTEVPRTAARANVAELNAKSEALFGADQRWMAFPTTPTAKDENENLHDQHKFYYTDEQAYQRALGTKNIYDPRNIFTSNAFSLEAGRAT